MGTITASGNIERLLDLLTTRREKPVYLEISERMDGTLDFHQVEFITPDQLAVMCNVETRTVYSWIERGICPPIYRAPGTRGILFDLHEAIQWIKGTSDN
ncbi:MAG TPA: hypothetical protein VFQ92_23595 [Blastocatellia bacterium]|nr:hypothetical protein [Blastocatellia bacterium]